MFGWVLNNLCILLDNFFTKLLQLQIGGDGPKYEWIFVWDSGRGGI